MKILLLYFLVCVVAAWIPAGKSTVAVSSETAAFPGWSAAPPSDDFQAVAPSEREQRFASDFPGKIGVFTDGTRTKILRWVRLPTRKLHPAADCLRALGYTLKPGPIFVESNGTRWGTSIARRHQETIRVSERIFDAEGHAWTDVSAWYWASVLGRSAGPWWAVTMIEPDRTKP